MYESSSILSCCYCGLSFGSCLLFHLVDWWFFYGSLTWEQGFGLLTQGVYSPRRSLVDIIHFQLVRMLGSFWSYGILCERHPISTLADRLHFRDRLRMLRAYGSQPSICSHQGQALRYQVDLDNGEDIPTYTFFDIGLPRRLHRISCPSSCKRGE
jgi:hypothetical protein